MSASICYTLSGKRRFRRQRGANGDFGNLQICRVLSPSEVLIRGKVCVRVFIEVSVRACCEHLCCTVLKKKLKDRIVFGQASNCLEGK